MNIRQLRKRITRTLLWEYPDLGVVTANEFVIPVGQASAGRWCKQHAASRWW